MLVYIDTNIYLSFIGNARERLKSIETLLGLIQKKEIKIFVPDITEDEYYRNIPVICKGFITNLNKFLPSPPSFSVSIMDKTVNKNIEKLYKDYEKEINSLKTKYIESVENFTKKIFSKICKLSEKKELTDTLFQKARIRKLQGNPPGKRNDPMGDEIVWELLLNSSKEDDIVIISNDSDWEGVPINQAKDKELYLNPLLTNEWNNTKTDKNIKLYSTIASFIKNKIKLPIDKAVIRDEIRIADQVDMAITSSDFNYISSPTGSIGPIGTIGPTGSSGSSGSLSPLSSFDGLEPLYEKACPRCSAPAELIRSSNNLDYKYKCSECGYIFI